MDESSVVELAKAGDHRAFEVLLRPLIEPAYALAGAMLMDPAEAEDAVQECVVKAWRGIGRLRGASCKSWFMTIVANRCRTVARRRRLRSLYFNQDRSTDGTDEGNIVAALDVQLAMRQLPPRDRALLVLRYYDDMALGDVARILGMTEGAVRVALHRAIRRLRPLLEVTA